MAKSQEPTDIFVTKSQHTNAQLALGKALKIRERLQVAASLGFPQDDIEQQLNEWQPRVEGVVQYYHQQFGQYNG